MMNKPTKLKIIPLPAMYNGSEECMDAFEILKIRMGESFLVYTGIPFF